MGTLTLNDGTEMSGYQVQTETRLFLYLFGVTLAEVFQALNNPEATKTIKWERDGLKGTVRGWKRLASISEESGGMICAGLKKT